MLSLWQVGNQVAQSREQLLEKGLPHQHLDSVLAEFRAQQIKAAKGTKVANAMAKKQGSVGEDEEAVAMVSFAVAGEVGEVGAGSAVEGEAGEVVAGSAVAGEAEQDDVWDKYADIEYDGVGPPSLEPKGLAAPLFGPPLELEDPTSASKPSPKKRRIQFVVAIEGPNKAYLSEVQAYVQVIMRREAFNHIAQEDPLPITKEAECGIQEPFNSGRCVTALARQWTYVSGFNLFWFGL